MRRFLSILILLSLFTLGCATNPVTGEKELSLVSEQQELQIGRQQYSPLRQSQGGDYVVDKQVQAYVDEVGQKLAAVSDRKLPYEFKVLNNSVPNAWALPGGKIAINWGLLTELESESELAAVLGHEVVHAAAKHSAKGMQRNMLLQGAVLAAAIAAKDSRYANLAQMGASVGAQLVNQKYGRDAERESDHYGMQYMSRAGYDPQGAVDLQKTFVKLSKERKQDWLSGLFSSHPPSPERVENNTKDAAALPKGGTVGRDRFKQKIARLIKTKPAYEAYEKAQKALKKDKPEQARALVNKAIKIEPREGHFHSLLGDIERKENNYTVARRHYDKAISLNSDFFYYHLQRGAVNQQKNNRTAAKRDLERSIELLPTADAYNSLGDIAKTEQRYAEAKKYYAKAAGNSSKVSKAAYGSLVDLDLPENPSKYIKTRSGVNRHGELMIEVSNPTPRDVTNMIVGVQFVDPSGQVRQLKHRVSGRLKAGTKEIMKLNVIVNPAQANKIRSQIHAARVAR